MYTAHPAKNKPNAIAIFVKAAAKAIAA